MVVSNYELFARERLDLLFAWMMLDLIMYTICPLQHPNIYIGDLHRRLDNSTSSHPHYNFPSGPTTVSAYMNARRNQTCKPPFFPFVIAIFRIIFGHSLR